MSSNEIEQPPQPETSGPSAADDSENLDRAASEVAHGPDAEQPHAATASEERARLASAPEPSEPQGPPTETEIDALIEAEVGEFIEKFEAEHPMMYRLLTSKLGRPLRIEMNTLVRDAVYKQLVADTDEAVDLGQIVKAIAEIVLMVAGRFLPLIG